MTIDASVIARTAMDASDALVVVLDTSGVIVLFNAACERATDYSAREVIGRSIWDTLIADEDMTQIQSVFADLASTGAPSSFENDWIAKDGSRRRIQWRNTIQRAPSGALEWVIGTGVDITDQRATERALAGHNARLDAVLKVSPDAIITITETGILSGFSRGAERVFGYTADEVLGRNVTILMTAPDRDTHDAHLKRYADTGEKHIIGIGREILAQRKDGGTFPVHLHVEEGWIGGARFFTGVLRDMTQTREVESKLAEQQHLLKAVFEAVPEAIVVADDTGAIFTCNPSFTQVFGYTEQEASCLPVSALFADSGDASMVIFESTEVDAEQTAARRIIDWRRANGETFPGQSFRATIDSASEGMKYFISIRDVSEEMRREEVLRQAQKLEAVGRLTGGMAHDFNNILTVIKGNLEMVHDLVDDADGQTMLAEAREAADMGASVVHQMLAFARRQALAPQILDVNQLISETADLLRRTLGSHIRLSLHLGSDLSPVRADPIQLKNALLNLVLNARDASDDGGSVAIETMNINIAVPEPTLDDGPAEGAYVSISVSDTGTGVAAEVRDHLFEPYVTTKPEGQGSGMGLSMVYGFVKQSGGHVTMHSVEGAGATFTLLLPQENRPDQDERPAEPVERHALRPAGGQEAILLVDDDARVRNMTKRRLESLGYTVTSAEDASSARTVLEGEGKIDLLLTDIAMPGRDDGPKLAQDALRLRPELKIVFMSGLADPSFVANEITEGTAAFLQKPHSLAMLDDTIRRTLKA